MNEKQAGSLVAVMNWNICGLLSQRLQSFRDAIQVPSFRAGWFHYLGKLVGKLVQWSSINKRWTVGVIFGLALVVRLLYILSLSQTLSFDEPYYHDIVGRLLTGQGYSFSSDAYHTTVAGQPTSFQEPVYPLFLSVLYTVFGLKNYFAARLCQAFVGSLIPVIVFLMGEKVLGKGIGLVAGLFLVVYPSLIYFNGLLMTETLFTCLFMIGLYALAWVIEKAPGYRDVVFGMLMGITILTRTVLLGVLPILFLWLWLYSDCRLAFRRIILVGAGCAVLILPWTARNFVVHRTFVPLTTKGGYNLYIYSYPVQNYDFNDRWDVIVFPDMSGLSEVERAHLLTSEGKKFIYENPLMFIDFAFRKLIDFWNPVPKTGNSLLAMANIVSFGGAALFTLIGLLLQLTRLKTHKPFVTLFYGLVGFYVFECMIFTGGMKARLPVEPLLVLLAVFSVDLLLRGIVQTSLTKTNF